MVASKSERGDRFIHGERLHVLIKELLKESSVDFDMLDGVCVGKDPGSYAGLRIGVSTAKGLCYAAGSHCIVCRRWVVLIFLVVRRLM